LVKNIPSTSNTVVLIDVDRVFNSPLAKSEGWRAEHERSFATGLAIIPPHTSMYATATQLDFDVMQPNWSISMLELNLEPSMSLLAREQKGVLEEIAELPTVEMPNDTFAVQFASRVVGIMSPANRQNVARWVRQSAAKTDPTLSPYLMSAVGFSDSLGTPIIMAMDLQDIMTRVEIRGRIDASPTLDRFKADKDQVAAVLSTIKSITLGVTINEKMFGKIKVNFGADAAPLKGFSKTLLLEVLDSRGAAIDGLAKWKSVVNGNQISIEGELSRPALQQIISIANSPVAHIRDPEAAKADLAKSPEALSLEATKKYYDAVQGYLKDLNSKSGANLKSTGQKGLYYERYAGRVDQLSTLNVDEEMLEYGFAVGDSLRNASAAIKGIGINTGIRTASVYQVGPSFVSGSRFGYYGWSAGSVGSYESRNVYAERRAITKEERGKGYVNSLQIMRQVDAMTRKIRLSMTNKYQVQF